MAKPNASAFMPAISLDKNAAIPLHRQLYSSLREAILSGQLRAGTRLPSTREMAQYVGVSRNTVLNAFEQLLAEGFLEGKIGSGSFVADAVAFAAHHHDAVTPRGNRPPASDLSTLLVNDKSDRPLRALGAFRASLPALDLFPWPAWSQMVARAARSLTREQLAYSDAAGLFAFREVIAGYLRTARNVRCEPEQVLIVSGSQQALCLAAGVLLNREDAVWMEEPGYVGARHAFVMNGNRIVPVPVDSDGLMVEEGRKRCPDARMAYVTPSHQYPLGVTMSLHRRLELLEWADSNNAWIVEDDYDSEYRYVTRPLSSLQGLSRQDRVIYTGTFSKVLFPALRLGYMVVPRDFVDRFAAVRAASDVYPSPLFQIALTTFIREGAFSRHVRRMRSVYSERLNELATSVKRDFAGILSIECQDSGMHVAAFLGHGIDDVRVAQAAAMRGVTVLPLSACHLSGDVRRGLILGFGGADVRQIRDGLAVLKEVLDDIESDRLAGSKRGGIST